MIFSIHSIMPFVTALLFATLGIYVFLKRRGAAENRAYAIWCYTTVHWQLTWSIIYSIRDPHLAEQLTRFGYTGIVFIPIAFYGFIIAFLKESSRAWHVKAAYALGCIFAITIWTGQLFVSHAQLYYWGYYPRVGWIHAFYLALLAYLVWDGISLLFRHSRSPLLPDTKKNQIRFVTYTCGIYVLASLDFLPNYGIAFYPIGVIFTFISLGLVAYAISKHHLLDIHMIFRKTLVYSVVSTTLAAAYAGIITMLAYLVGGQAHSPFAAPYPAFSLKIVAHWLADRIRLSFGDVCIVTALLSMGFGLFVLWKGSQKKVNVLWCIVCLTVAVWSYGLGMVLRSEHFAQAYFWTIWFTHIGAIFIPILFFHFILILIKRKAVFELTSGYVLAITLSLLTVCGYLVSVQQTPAFRYYPAPLPLYKVFLAYFLGLVVYAHWLLANGIRKSEGKLKKQLRAIFIGTSVGFIGGSTTFFPALGIPLFPYGSYAVPVYILMISYAIFKHQLMDINVVIRKTLIYSLLSAALAAVYVGTITVLAQVLGSSRGPSSAVSSALAAIFITLLFNPVRIRVQRFVDHYFLRESMDQTVLREITGALVHEIKTPLSNIALPAELTLMDMEELEKMEKAPKAIIGKVKKRMKYIMEQALIAGSKVEAVREATIADDVAQGTLDLRQVIKSSLKQMEDRLRKPMVTVHLTIPSFIKTIPGSAKQLEIVFANLLKNAAEAMEELPRNKAREINIHADVNDGYVVVQVSDTGPGVKPEDADRIFQSHYTTKGSRGAGMGLHLSRQIIQAHGGNIGVVDMGKLGATFEIQLPMNGINTK